MLKKPHPHTGLTALIEEASVLSKIPIELLGVAARNTAALVDLRVASGVTWGGERASAILRATALCVSPFCSSATGESWISPACTIQY